MQRTVLITSWLEPEHVQRIRDTDPRLEVIYEPELLAPPRYIADHSAPVTRPPEQESRWRSYLSRAEILFDFDKSSGREMASLAPNVKWVQATSAGIGEGDYKRSGSRIGAP